MPMAAPVPRYTAEEVRRFPDDRLRYEVIRGELFVTPAPETPHQRAVVQLTVQLHVYLATHRLGEVLPGPFEVEFTEDSAVQPDGIVILQAQHSRLSRKRLNGPPALAIEIVSYSSKRTDRLQKRLLYQEEGVNEYWIVDLDQRQIERWGPADTAPEILTEHLTWQPATEMPAFHLDLPSLFATTNA
jgi:Uma2 family endonuclease